MKFEYPLQLVLLVPAVALFVWSCFRGGLAGRKGGANLLLRFVAVAFVIVGFARPFKDLPTSPQAMQAFLDISQSIGDSQGDALLAKARKLSAETSIPLTIVPFANEVYSGESIVDRGESFAQIRARYQALDTGHSDIKGALAKRSDSPLALLLSDGYENLDSEKSRSASPIYLRVFPLLADGEDPAERLQITQLNVPKVVPAKKQADIRATVTNHGDVPQEARITISHGERVVSAQTIVIPSRQDFVLSTLSDPTQEGLRSVAITLSWRDVQGEHTLRRSAWLAGEKREQVLVVSGNQSDDRFLSTMLLDDAYQLRSVVGTGNAEDFGTLGDYQVIVLNNLHSKQIAPRVLRGLKTFVQDGGSLVCIGGDTSYGLGGYIGSQLEELLPVKLIPPHKESKRLGVAVQLIIDKSRSMITDNRLEYAKRAAAAVVQTLKDDDFIGIIGFDEVPFVALPLSPVARVRSVALSRISRLFPTSRTNLYPALEEARRGLSSVRAGRKHMVVLTDGKIPDPGPYYFELLKQARFLGITLSTILVGGEEDDGFLDQLARRGGGAFYQTSDPSKLPKIFLSDVRVATEEQTMREEDSIPVTLGPRGVRSTSITSYPNLKGYVQTETKPGAVTELVVRSKKGTYPLLASQTIGKGRVLAFTSDANGRWSADWFRWSRIREFWSDIISSMRGVRGKTKGALTDFEARTWVEGTTAVLDVAIFENEVTGDLRGSIESPRGDRTSVQFKKLEEGHYQARIDRIQAGTYKADLSLGERKIPEFAWDISGDLFGEQPHRTPNLSLLTDLASQTGGSVEPDADTVRGMVARLERKRFYVWECMLLALFFYATELLVRLRPNR